MSVSKVSSSCPALTDCFSNRICHLTTIALGIILILGMALLASKQIATFQNVPSWVGFTLGGVGLAAIALGQHLHRNCQKDDKGDDLAPISSTTERVGRAAKKVTSGKDEIDQLLAQKEYTEALEKAKAISDVRRKESWILKIARAHLSYGNGNMVNTILRDVTVDVSSKDKLLVEVVDGQLERDHICAGMAAEAITNVETKDVALQKIVRFHLNKKQFIFAESIVKSIANIDMKEELIFDIARAHFADPKDAFAGIQILKLVTKYIGPKEKLLCSEAKKLWASQNPDNVYSIIMALGYVTQNEAHVGVKEALLIEIAQSNYNNNDGKECVELIVRGIFIKRLGQLQNAHQRHVRSLFISTQVTSFYHELAVDFQADRKAEVLAKIKAKAELMITQYQTNN